MKRTDAELEAEISHLSTLDKPNLYRKFQALHGVPAPPRLSRYLLELAIAYKLQVEQWGGLSAAIRAELMEGKKALPKAGPGTMLMREWHGVHHLVTVHADGVEYKGQRFGSLTEVAKVITGQKWSGPRFFGLSKRKSEARA